jgi:hypothetical protein
MKWNKSFVQASLWAVTALMVPSLAEANACMAAAFSDPLPKGAEWRGAFTHNDGVPSSAKREAEMRENHKEMSDQVLGVGEYRGHGDTPPMEFFAAEGVGAKFEFKTDGISGKPTRILLSNLGAEGLLRGTLLVPVSGHTGAANARAWSKTDTYTLKLDTSKDAAGKQWNNSYSESGPEAALVSGAKSLDIITAHDLNIQMAKGKGVRILYFRSGSGGPSGYFEGRVIELIWDGT